jgi:hypothetical protein
VDGSNDSEIRLIAKVSAAFLLVPALSALYVTWKIAEDWGELGTVSTTISVVLVVGLMGALTTALLPRFFHPFLKVYFLIGSFSLVILGLWMGKGLISLARTGPETLLTLFITCMPLTLSAIHWWALRRLRRATSRTG